MPNQENSRSWKLNAGFFVAGQFVSLFGSMLVSHAVTWYIIESQQSGTLVAAFTAAALLPLVFISPFAGVWADRYNRKHLVNGADAAIALVTLAVALLFTSGIRSVWLLLTASMIRSVGQGVQQPAVNALIPQIVPGEHLARFNAIQGASQSLTMFATPMVAGALMFFLPVEYIFYIDVATAIIGISTVFFCVKVTHTPNLTERKPGVNAYFNEMKEGLKFVASQPWLKTLLIGTAVFMVLASPAAMLTPLQVQRSFGDDGWQKPAIELAFSLGMVLGGIVLSIWGGFKNKIKSLMVSWIIFAVTTVLFGVVPNIWIYLVVMGVCGCAMPLYNTPSMTLMQTKIPQQYMGRVFSVLSMISGLAMPLGMALFGPLGDVVKIEYLLIVTGILMFIGGLILNSRKELRAVGED